jgi:hypothetical protein
MFNVDVSQVHPLPGRRLRLRFSDGVEAVLELDRVVRRYEGVFAALKDDAYFGQVRVDHELGTIVWPNGADLCPDVLYSHVTGRPIVVQGERVLN